MDRELAHDRDDDVRVEDVGLWALLGQFLKRLLEWVVALLVGLLKAMYTPTSFKTKYTNLGPRDAQEAHGHEHARDGRLQIAKLDTVQVQNRERVGRDEAVKRKNLVHLDRGNERAAALSDDVVDCE
ncbi:hypothetical protein BC936DRAFT_137175 [Jimgerdemannia flammicorona]|nr:hypothetical protein BC936DRAFT_137175 [Jimgerdemannia flammicorona]